MRTSHTIDSLALSAHSRARSARTCLKQVLSHRLTPSSCARVRFVLCAKLFTCHMRTSHTLDSLALIGRVASQFELRSGTVRALCQALHLPHAHFTHLRLACSQRAQSCCASSCARKKKDRFPDPLYCHHQLDCFLST